MANFVKALIGVGILAGIGYVAYKYLYDGPTPTCRDEHSTSVCQNGIVWDCVDNSWQSTGNSCSSTSIPTSPGTLYFNGEIVGPQTPSMIRDSGDHICTYLPLPTTRPYADFAAWDVEINDQFGNPISGVNITFKLANVSEPSVAFVVEDGTMNCDQIVVKTDANGFAHFTIIEYRRPSKDLQVFWTVTLAGQTFWTDFVVYKTGDGYLSANTCEDNSPIAWTKEGC